MIDTTIIITSYKEPETLIKAIESILFNNKQRWETMEMIVVAPDSETISSARNIFEKYPEYKNSKVLKDMAKGKPEALNLAVRDAKGSILILTDGDMYVSPNAIDKLLAHFSSKTKDNSFGDNIEKSIIVDNFDNSLTLGGVSGHPVSKDNRGERFGYYSHLFCEAAHQKRSIDNNMPMSGYLYAFKNIDKLFPIPPEIRAEDAYISSKLLKLGYKLEYEPEAIAYVSFPKNSNDWIKQKLRSLGGNVQIERKRNILEDIKFGFFPILFAKNFKELGWSLALYPLRLKLWYLIYKQHMNKSYSKGKWERIESSK